MPYDKIDQQHEEHARERAGNVRDVVHPHRRPRNRHSRGRRRPAARNHLELVADAAADVGREDERLDEPSNPHAETDENCQCEEGEHRPARAEGDDSASAEEEEGGDIRARAAYEVGEDDADGACVFLDKAAEDEEEEEVAG